MTATLLPSRTQRQIKLKSGVSLKGSSEGEASRKQHFSQYSAPCNHTIIQSLFLDAILSKSNTDLNIKQVKIVIHIFTRIHKIFLT